MAADATSAGESSSTTSTTHTLTPPEAHVQRTLDLLEHERETDLAQMSLLASRCPPKLLEAKGLAILNLRVSNISLGLGGKTLVELEHYMKSTLPSHSFRNGDTCEILVSEAANTGAGAAKGRSGTASKGQKGKEKEKGGDGSSTTSSNLQGIVYRVNDDRVIVALDQSTDRDEKDLDIPEKCRMCVCQGEAGSGPRATQAMLQPCHAFEWRPSLRLLFFFCLSTRLCSSCAFRRPRPFSADCPDAPSLLPPHSLCDTPQPTARSSPIR